MKRIVISIGIVFIVFLSCSRKKNSNSSSSPAQPELTASPWADSSLFISPFSWFSFRRSYSNAQFMDNDKEIERYLDEQNRASPWLTSVKYDTAMLKQLQKFKLVKNEELLEHRFSKMKKGYFDFTDVSGKKLHLSFSTVFSVRQSTKIINRDSCQILTFSTNESSYTIKDVIPGGNPEIIVVDKYYFMLGYIFDLTIYEICYK
jgi:hypothetical protein